MATSKAGGTAANYRSVWGSLVEGIPSLKAQATAGQVCLETEGRVGGRGFLAKGVARLTLISLH